MADVYDDLNTDELLDLSVRLAKEGDYKALAHAVMRALLKVSAADFCLFFLVEDGTFVNFSGGVSENVKLNLSGTETVSLFPAIYLPDVRQKKFKTPLEQSASMQGILNLSDVYMQKELDTSLTAQFDLAYDYVTVSELFVPLIDRRQEMLGIVQLVNARDNKGKVGAFTSEVEKKVQGLSALLTMVYENRKSHAQYKQLLESFIDVLARAIDTKSAYTRNHCQRVPIIARLLASAVVEEDSGKFRDFQMSPEDWYALHIASWLHDCGKVTTPEYIVDKATKLETINNRIHEIRTRFEILRRDAHIEYLQKRLKNVDTQQNLQAEFVSRVQKLEEDFAFVARCNKGDVPLSDDEVLRLEQIAQSKFMRYFDRTLGLSWAEKEKIEDFEALSNPAVEHLLQDRPDQIFPPFNRGELYNLSIRQGTINKEEREKVNEHVVVTVEMLNALHFPKELSNVVEYAGCHHERVDGKGYPNGLTGEQMSIPARIMAIADIFEALTADDRPYKEPKKLSEVLQIMRDMKMSGHIDPDLFDVFVRGEVYKDYAKQYMKEKQIDDVNPEDFL